MSQANDKIGNLTNTAIGNNGDTYQAGRDLNLIQPEQSGLQIAIERLRERLRSEPAREEYIERFSDYLIEIDREMIGLEAKLEMGNRRDLINKAIYLKNKAAKILEKNQLSEARQLIYVHILAAINSEFDCRVLPLIHDGKTRLEIDKEVLSIVKEIYKATADPDVDLNQDDLRGMLFYLTGKCHISWSY